MMEQFFQSPVEILLRALAMVTFIWALDRTRKVALRPLHVMQLEGYDNDEYGAWMKAHPESRFGEGVTSIQNKSPLVMTERATRLFQKHMIVNVLLLFLGLLFSWAIKSSIIGLGVALVIAGVLCNLQFHLMKFSNTLAKPKEEKINRGFYVAAKEKVQHLKAEGLTVVGITGSFGKTSTKFIANDILSESFQVQNTPSSYNTPMGLSKVINNDLDETKEIFLAELGAKVPGEIAEVAELVQPTIGVLTAIGPTHMHLFKSIDRIKETKYELIEALPDDGTAIFNLDNSHVRELAEKTTRLSWIGYGFSEDATVRATDLEVGSRGSRFTLAIDGQAPVSCETVLLGKHNIQNLLAGAAIGHILGMSPEAIARGIQKVSPVEHRLQLIEGPTGVLVIDDAFNSNPVGARAALEVLGAFSEAKKIVITPGMVELGDQEEEENYAFGKEMAKVADAVILVGPKRTEPIKRGLVDGGYPEAQTFVAKSLDEATKISASLTKPGDVVLIENDLPDTYNEI